MSDSLFRQLKSGSTTDVRANALCDILSDHDGRLEVLAAQVKSLGKAVKRLETLGKDDGDD